jgi:hypothetical protein
VRVSCLTPHAPRHDFFITIKKPAAGDHAAALKGAKAMKDTASAVDGRNTVIERSFDLPFGYRATFIWRRPDEPFEVRWSPNRPRIGKSRPQRKFLAAYQAARRKFFDDVAAVGGGMILIVDTDLKTVCEREVIVPPTQH